MKMEINGNLYKFCKERGVIILNIEEHINTLASHIASSRIYAEIVKATGHTDAYERANERYQSKMAQLEELRQSYSPETTPTGTIKTLEKLEKKVKEQALLKEIDFVWKNNQFYDKDVLWDLLDELGDLIEGED